MASSVHPFQSNPDDGVNQQLPYGSGTAYGYGDSSATMYSVVTSSAPSTVYPAPTGAGYSGQPDHKDQPQQAVVNLRDQIQTGRWAAGLCSCCDSCVPNCMMSWCCPCVALAQIYARIGMMTYKAALALFFVLYVIGLAGNFIPSSSSGQSTKYYNYSTHSYVTTAAAAPSSDAAQVAFAIAIVGQLVLRAYMWRARAAIRKRYNVPGSCCCDCCTIYWCSCCAVAQMATHVKSYVPKTCGFDGPEVLPGYTL